MAQASIFLSYRRADTKAIIGRIGERLEQRFGKSAVFLDFESIRAGHNFREYLEATLLQSDIVLAVIGPNWHASTGTNRSRLFDQTDWVRVELETALEKEIPIIPILVDRAPMPKATELPESLHRLCDLQAVDLDSGLDFNVHIRRLITAIEDRLSLRPEPRARVRYAAIFATVAALVIGALLFTTRVFEQPSGEGDARAIAECKSQLTFQCAQRGGVFAANEALGALRSCKSADLIPSDDPRLRWKDIWTTSVYSFAPGGGGPGGGLENDELRVGGWADWYVALIQFDVPKFRAPPRFAGLALYSKESEGVSVPIEVDRIIQRWDYKKGDRLWWKDRPGSRAITSEPLPAPRKEQWYLIDLTAMVQEWVDGKAENYGIQIRPVRNFGSFVFFVSSRADDKTRIPRLVACA
jgi:TIR domain